MVESLHRTAVKWENDKGQVRWQPCVGNNYLWLLLEWHSAVDWTPEPIPPYDTPALYRSRRLALRRAKRRARKLRRIYARQFRPVQSKLDPRPTQACTGDPCTCTNGIGCTTIPYELW